MSQPEPSVEDVVAFVREFTRVGSRQPVNSQTRLEADLGVTGDDGADLLEATAARYGLDHEALGSALVETLGLGPDEFVFGPEGLDLIGIGALVRWVRREPRPSYRDLTVSELHGAVLAASRSHSAAR